MIDPFNEWNNFTSLYPVFENAYCVHSATHLLIVYNLRKASWGVGKMWNVFSPFCQMLALESYEFLGQ